MKRINKKNSTQKIDVSIVIVNYNTKDLLVSCLNSVYQTSQSRYAYEVLVVDNGSTDGSKEIIPKQFPQVSYIYLDANTGFATANNIGIQQSHGRFVLLLNSDTEVSSTSIPDMVDFLVEDAQRAAVTPRLTLSDGTIDPACHRGFPTPWASLCYFLGFERLFPRIRIFSAYHQWYKDMSVAHEVDSISGAFFLTRREVIEQVGFLDEQFFMYAEDIDWAYRMKQSDWQIWYNPEVEVLHKKKQSGRAHKDAQVREKTESMFYETMWQFYKKHYIKKYSPLVSFLVYIALIGKKKFKRS